MEYYSAIRNNDFMKFLEKWMYLENLIQSEVPATYLIVCDCKESGEHFSTAGEVVNWYNHSGNQSGGSSEKWT